MATTGQRGQGGVEFKAKPKLYYFDIKGRAEAIRLALHIGGIEFEDVRLDRDTFQRMKQEGKFPFGQLPVLEVDNRMLSQSMAILGWAGHYAKMNPGSSDVWREGKVWEFLNGLQDCMSKIATTIMETDQNKRMQLRDRLSKQELPEAFQAMDRLMQTNQRELGGDGKWVAGKDMTTADVQLFTMHDWLSSGVLEGVPTDIMNRYPNLMKSIEGVRNHPKVKEWYSQPGRQGAMQAGGQQQQQPQQESAGQLGGMQQSKALQQQQGQQAPRTSPSA